ncbi:unnamed protein product, partial [Medioppia subpectinata]
LGSAAQTLDFPHVVGEGIQLNEISSYTKSLGDKAIEYIRTQQQKDNNQGLTVVSQFYQDCIDAFTPIARWLLGELQNTQEPILQLVVTSTVMGQFYDLTIMIERLSELRAVKPLSVTGNEHNLINRLKALESRVLAAVESAQARGPRGLRTNPVMKGYYDKTNAFLSAEFSKLNEAIGNLPSAPLRQQTIQQLIIDLTHFAEMPFML